MTVIFKDLKRADIQKVLFQVLHGQIEYKLSDSRIGHIFHGLIWIKLVFWVADTQGNISLIRLWAVQSFDNYLPEVWNIDICYNFYVEFTMTICNIMSDSYF